jgi:hypothetical protein
MTKAISDLQVLLRGPEARPSSGVETNPLQTIQTYQSKFDAIEAQHTANLQVEQDGTNILERNLLPAITAVERLPEPREIIERTEALTTRAGQISQAIRQQSGPSEPPRTLLPSHATDFSSLSQNQARLEAAFSDFDASEIESALQKRELFQELSGSDASYRSTDRFKDCETWSKVIKQYETAMQPLAGGKPLARAFEEASANVSKRFERVIGQLNDIHSNPEIEARLKKPEIESRDLDRLQGEVERLEERQQALLLKMEHEKRKRVREDGSPVSKLEVEVQELREKKARLVQDNQVLDQKIAQLTDWLERFRVACAPPRPGA